MVSTNESNKKGQEMLTVGSAINWWALGPNLTFFIGTSWSAPGWFLLLLVFLLRCWGMRRPARFLRQGRFGQDLIFFSFLFFSFRFFSFLFFIIFCMCVSCVCPVCVLCVCLCAPTRIPAIRIPCIRSWNTTRGSSTDVTGCLIENKVKEELKTLN